MEIRKAAEQDLDAIEQLYNDIHTAEETHRQTIGWIRGVYPTRATAEAALKRGDLFVLEDGGRLHGTAILNKNQVEAYRRGHWHHPVPDDSVCVLHTLVIAPDSAGKGYGRAFLEFYEGYALSHGCRELRIDTNAKNTAARAMYKKHGYTEIDVIPTDFNGIPDIRLVLLEKYLEA